MTELLASIKHPEVFIAAMVVVLTLDLAVIGAILSEVVK